MFKIDVGLPLTGDTYRSEIGDCGDLPGSLEVVRASGGHRGRDLRGLSFVSIQSIGKGFEVPEQPRDEVRVDDGSAIGRPYSSLT